MAAIAEKRLKRRYLPDGSFTIHHGAKPCRVVDISITGLGISYIGGEDWPEHITLEYSLASDSGRKRLVKCRTAWESSMDFYKIRSEESVRRRGLEFIEPGLADVVELYRHLKSMAVENQ
jgi:hypothetical protein